MRKKIVLGSLAMAVALSVPTSAVYAANPHQENQEGQTGKERREEIPKGNELDRGKHNGQNKDKDKPTPEQKEEPVLPEKEEIEPVPVPEKEPVEPIPAPEKNKFFQRQKRKKNQLQ